MPPKVTIANLEDVAEAVATGIAAAPAPPSVVSAGYSATVSHQRPNDTTSYTAGDVLGPTTGTSAMAFTPMGPAGGRIMITSARLERDVTALISGETSYSLYLYDRPPVSALADNAVFDIATTDRVGYLGKINLGTPVDEVSTLSVDTDGINKQVKLASGSTTLYAYLVSVGAYAPAANTVLSVTLSAVAV